MTTGNEKVHIGFEVSKKERELWQRHADELDMTYSDYYRSMIRAGKRDITIETSEERNSADDLEGLVERIRDKLSVEEPLSFDELVDEIVGEIEDDIENALINIDEATYRPRSGGYILNEFGDK